MNISYYLLLDIRKFLTLLSLLLFGYSDNTISRIEIIPPLIFPLSASLSAINQEFSGLFFLFK